jgi:hypothetical protein
MAMVNLIHHLLIHRQLKPFMRCLIQTGMSRAPFIVIDGRLYRWKDILDLRRAQLAAAGAAEASQLALFATLHDDRRPPAERTASGRYLQPGLFAN